MQIKNRKERFFALKIAKKLSLHTVKILKLLFGYYYLTLNNTNIIIIIIIMYQENESHIRSKIYQVNLYYNLEIFKHLKMKLYLAS